MKIQNKNVYDQRTGDWKENNCHANPAKWWPLCLLLSEFGIHSVFAQTFISFFWKTGEWEESSEQEHCSVLCFFIISRSWAKREEMVFLIVLAFYNFALWFEFYIPYEQYDSGDSFDFWNFMTSCVFRISSKVWWLRLWSNYNCEKDEAYFSQCFFEILLLLW